MITCRGIFDLASKEAEVARLEAQMAEDGFWDDQKSAQKAISECNNLRVWTLPYNDLKRRFEGVAGLLPDAFDSGDQPFCDELLRELSSVEEALSELELRKMLSGEMDSKNCYLEINAGAGGTEACD